MRSNTAGWVVCALLLFSGILGFGWPAAASPACPVEEQIKWYAEENGKRVYPGGTSSLPIEFEWRGYRWRIPLTMLGTRAVHDCEFKGFNSHLYFVAGRLLPYLEARHFAEGLKIPIRIYVNDHNRSGPRLEQRLDRYGAPIDVPWLEGMQFYPWYPESDSGDLWRSKHFVDPLGHPLEVFCVFKVSSVLNNEVVEIGKRTKRGCRTYISVAEGFSVMVDLRVTDLPKVERIVRAVIDLVGSWMIKE